MPDGKHHPFAQTMLKHFEKLCTPLRAIDKYPKLEDQKRRFTDLGWTTATAWNLWTLWEDSNFLASDPRAALNSVEPFDEWEELALFASHYFLLVASKPGVDIGMPYTSSHGGERESLSLTALPERNLDVLECDYPRDQGRKRFGALVEIDSDSIALHGGETTRGRVSTCDVYSTIDRTIAMKRCPPQTAYTCHTITKLDMASSILVGGRTSPDKANSECWLVNNGSWTRTDELRPGRYRHCAASIQSNGSDDTDARALIFGGKTSSGAVLGDWMVWHRRSGWRMLEVIGQGPAPRFGAAMAVSHQFSTVGLLLGGMTEDGAVIVDLWEWRVDPDFTKISFRDVRSLLEPATLQRCARFGANLVSSAQGFYLIGGIVAGQLLQREDEVLIIRQDWSVERVQQTVVENRPLLIGAGTASVGNGDLIVVGGGAVCFSFGSFWNKSSYTLHDPSMGQVTPWKLQNAEIQYTATVSAQRRKDDSEEIRNGMKPATGKVKRIRIKTEEDFQSIVERGQPAVIEGLSLGPCTELWTMDYLKSRIGADCSVSPKGEFLPTHFVNSDFLQGRSSRFSQEADGFREQKLRLCHDDLRRFSRRDSKRRNALSPSSVYHKAFGAAHPVAIRLSRNRRRFQTARNSVPGRNDGAQLSAKDLRAGEDVAPLRRPFERTVPDPRTEASGAVPSIRRHRPWIRTGRVEFKLRRIRRRRVAICGVRQRPPW